MWWQYQVQSLSFGQWYYEYESYYGNIKENTESGLICTLFISTENQLAVVLTKRLPSNKFQQFIKKLGIQDIHSPA